MPLSAFGGGAIFLPLENLSVIALALDASLLAGANQDETTSFAERRGEFLYATGPTTLDPSGTYRIVTNDWGAKNSVRYFGEPALTWTTLPDLRLKAVAARAISAP